MSNLKNEVKCKKLEDLIASSTARYTKLGLNPEKDMIVPMNIGCNAGNYFVKNVGPYGKNEYRTAATVLPKEQLIEIEESMASGQQPNVIDINGVLYQVGTGRTLTGFLVDKPMEEFRAVMLMAIAKQIYLKKSHYKKLKLIEVSIGVGLSIDEYREKENRDLLRKILAGMHHVKYQGLEFVISIAPKNVVISAEGYAHYQANFKDYVGNDDKGIYIIDIGSKTLDTVWIQNGAIKDNDCEPNLGVLKLVKDIYKSLPVASRRYVSEVNVEELIRKGSVKRDKLYEMGQFITLKESYEKEMILYLNDRYPELAVANRLVLIGGGEYVAGDYIKNYYINTADNIETFKDSEYLNAEAYYALSFK